ncbi:MAG: outer membrane beta-barrel protein [Prevotella sp.]|nr:outer membrane beta-barrel protein [Prevotella sp.]
MKKIVCALAAVLFSMNAVFAGGILTNTNQSVSFLRNPARDAAIGLDGVYSNPAGVAFLSDGLHLGFNWQYAHQTRTITSTNSLFALGLKNNGQATKEFEGVANAPIIPSLQAAYNKNNWSFQFNFSVPGGGGKCEFDKGIGSFETVVGAIANRLIGVSTGLNQSISQLGASVPNVTGYDVDGYMKGKQFYFGFQVGAAHKFNEHLSVYGGLRLLYGTASYEARLNNIRVMNGNTGMTLPEYFMGVTNGLTTAGNNLAALSQQVKDGIQQYVAGYMAAGMTQEQAMQQPAVQDLVAKGQQLQASGAQLQATAEQLEGSAATLAPYTNGVNLKSDQTGWGIAPVIGIDYKTGPFNFAAKYEFKTRMRMKNNSDLKEASVISATNKYVNGTSVPEDSPAQLALGAQWSVLDNVRLNAGYHHFFDTDAHWYEHSEKLLDGGTNEYLAGAEWDVNDRLTVSGGVQFTRYPLTDEYMNDMSFVVNSWTFGLGLEYKVSKKVKLSAAYFQTNYEDYNMNTPEQNMEALGLNIPAGKNSFTRTNRVVGVGVEVTL